MYLSLFCIGDYMGKLTFGKTKRRFNYDLLRVVLTWAFQIAVVCFVAFVFVWYFGKRISVTGDSMNPILANGDETLVNKLVYNLGSPRRGDVIAFQPNGNEHSHYYIKRVVGLPGETIEIKKGQIWIDGKKIKEKYQTTEISDKGVLEEPVTLKNNEYFVLGDDRQNSDDSRSADVGNIKRSDIIGTVWFVTSGKNFGFVK